MKPIEEIRKAFHHIHAYATGATKQPYMEIPANPERDADLIVMAALDELEALRAEVTALSNAGNAELAAYQEENARLREELARTLESLSTAKALALEEAAQWLDARCNRHASRAIRALAPLPPGLVAMRVEDRDAVREALDLAISRMIAIYDALSIYDATALNPAIDAARAALAILDRSAR